MRNEYLGYCLSTLVVFTSEMIEKELGIIVYELSLVGDPKHK